MMNIWKINSFHISINPNFDIISCSGGARGGAKIVLAVANADLKKKK